jgi:hypothetical protein
VDELAFYFYVTPRFFPGRKSKILRCTGLTSEEQFSRLILLSGSVAGRRPLSQQECIQDVIHTSIRSKFEKRALESVEKAFGPFI